MQLSSIGLAFGFLFLTLLLFAPLVLIVSCAKKARLLAIALIVSSNVVGSIVAALCFWRESVVCLDLSRLAPFSFALGVDKLGAFFSCWFARWRFRLRSFRFHILTTTIASGDGTGCGFSFRGFSYR